VEIAINTPGPGLNAAANDTDRNSSQVEKSISVTPEEKNSVSF
jgi:hypothetical protein